MEPKRPMELISISNMIRRVMFPIVKLMISHGMPLQTFVQLAKEIYVDVADTIISRDYKTVTDSQISVMTGVHRKDVKLIRDNKTDYGSQNAEESVSHQIIAKWLGCSDYLDENGIPLPLPYVSKDGESNFYDLVESISQDVRPKAHLKALLQLGYINYDPVLDIVTLNDVAYRPNQSKENKLFFWGKSGSDHLSAATENVLSDLPPYLDRIVYHDGLSKESVDQLHKLSQDGGMKLLKNINRKAFELSECDKGKMESTQRFTLGIYFYNEHYKD